MPKTLKERLDWLYANDPIFRAEKDLVDSIQKTQQQKQKGVENETSNRYKEDEKQSGDLPGCKP